MLVKLAWGKIFFKPFLKLAHTKNGHAYHRLESEPRCQQSFQIQESENRAAKRDEMGTKLRKKLKTQHFLLWRVV